MATTKAESTQMVHNGVPLSTVLTEYSSSVGASKIGYMPDGSGVVATDVQSKFRESVSVKDFGAVGRWK